MAMGTQAASQTGLGAVESLFAERTKAKYMELMETGQCRPFTIINFNPVPMALEGELSRYRIPSPDDERLPKDVQRVAVDWDGKQRIGHALTLREPHMYGRMVNATAKDGNIAEAIPERDVMYYLPQAIAYAFLEHFSAIFVTKGDKMATPPPKDARRCFGVLAFEGDLHTIDGQLKLLKVEMEREAAGVETDPRIPVTERAHVRVPIARVITVGRSTSRIYEAVPYPLRDYLQQMFAGQLGFAKVQLARAQQKWSETQTVKDISESDRVWFRWAARLGYVEFPKRGEKHWVNEVLDVSGMNSTADGVALRKCQSCRSQEPEANTPFCPKCGAPIDTFATFMAGFPVAEAWLQTLRGEQREQVLAELGRRREGFGEAAGQQPGKRGSYKNGRGAKAAVDPAEDGGTELPGE